MNKLKTILKFSAAAFLVVFVTLIVFGSLSVGGWKALSEQTGSMRPALKPGDLVLVKRVSAASLNVGDIITYKSPYNTKETITHRIVQKMGKTDGPQTFIVQGDANAARDAPVPQNKVVGKVSYHVPYVGKAIDFIKTLPGLVLIIYIPAVVIVVGELRRLTAYYQSLRPYRLAGYDPNHGMKTHYNFTQSFKLLVFCTVAVISFIISAQSVTASLHSDAKLTGNTISTHTSSSTNTCIINSSNNASVTINSNQSSTSGSSSVNGNSASGSATSGNATNTNSSSVNIQQSNQTHC